jgi:hypothetical protein
MEMSEATCGDHAFSAASLMRAPNLPEISRHITSPRAKHMPPTCPGRAATWTHSAALLGAVSGGTALPCLDQTFRGMTVKKIVIALGATLALVTAANAADLPRRQPVPVYPAEQAPIGKMPIGKSPVGKAPIGKAPGPVAARY